MKYLMLFLCFAVVISTVLASGSGSDPDAINGEIVMYDVYADSNTSERRFNHNANAELSASASVWAESGSEGWYSVWAEAGSDRPANNPHKDYNSSGSYVAGSGNFSKSQSAHSFVGRFFPNWGYLYRSASITSQDDFSYSPR